MISLLVEQPIFGGPARTKISASFTVLFTVPCHTVSFPVYQPRV